MGKYYINPELIITFNANHVDLTLPRSSKVINADAATLRLISAIVDQSDGQLKELQDSYTAESLAQAMELLIDEEILVLHPKVSDISTRWKDWGHITWAFHLITKDTRFATSDEERLASALFTSQTEPPPRYKCICDKSKESISLPPPSHIEGDVFSQILVNRRTCRSFLDTPLKINDISNLLFYTGGVLFENDTLYYGVVLKKTAPSPGARHATEIYPVIQNCHEIENGIYHYCVEHHKLNLITSTIPFDFLQEALINQPYFANAPLIVFFTTVVNRLMWKYQTPRIYRLAHFEVAHYCQNFLLTGTALGLGVFSTAALADSRVEETIGIDGVDEFIMYAAGAGFEKQSERNARRGVVLSSNLPDGIKPKLPLI